MSTSLTLITRNTLLALMLVAAMVGMSSCGGGGTPAPADAGGIVNGQPGQPSFGGGNGSGGADGAADVDGGNANAGAGGIGGTGGTTGDGGDASAGSGGIGGSGGTTGDGSTGTADGGSGAGGGIGGTGSPSTAGVVHFFLADAPSCGFDAVNVTVERVRIHASNAAGGADNGWSEVPQSPPKRVDLLTLINGVFLDLGKTTLPAGKYKQVRLVLAENNNAHPLANSVIPTGESETALTTPGGSQSGIKLDTDVDVVAGKTTSLVLDFDACKSVVRRGNSGEFNLKPVITVLRLASGAGFRVTGYVAPALANASTKVSVQAGGMPVRTTVPDSNGRFELYPVPAGVYDLVITSEGRAATVKSGVPVTAASPTIVNRQTQSIDLPWATLRAVSGTVHPATSSVRVVQALGNGTTVEVGWASVDQATGSFMVYLPIASTLRALHSSSALSPDSAVGSRYTVEARSGSLVQGQVIDTLGAVPQLNFSLH
jgi:hypothetical protein